MSNDPIAQAWADQPLDKSTIRSDAPNRSASISHKHGAEDVSVIAADAAAAHRADQRQLRRLTMQEVIPSLVVAAIFASAAGTAAEPWATWAAAVTVLAVGCFMVVNALPELRPVSTWGHSLRDDLERRLHQVRHRARLYRLIAWWYLLPLAVAIVMFRYGVAGKVRLETGDIVYYAVCAVFFLVLYVVNRRIGRTRYESQVDHLERILADFDS